MATIVYHGSGLSILLGLIATVLLYLVLPIVAVVLALKCLGGRDRNRDRSRGSDQAAFV